MTYYVSLMSIFIRYMARRKAYSASIMATTYGNCTAQRAEWVSFQLNSIKESAEIEVPLLGENYIEII